LLWQVYRIDYIGDFMTDLNNQEPIQQILTLIQSIDARLISLESKVDERLHDTRPIWEQLNKRLDAFEKRMDSLEKRLDSLEKRVSSIESQLTLIQKDIKIIREDLHELRHRQSYDSLKLADLEKRVDDIDENRQKH
jgi:DNA repair exonuclease SbcCD ATPase subunit